MQELRERQGQRASVMAKEGILVVQAQSGRGLLCDDPQAFKRILPSDAEPELVGSAVREALSASRFFAPNEARHFLATAQEARSLFLQEIATVAGVAVPQLFKGMRLCHVVLTAGSMKFVPTARIKREAWEGLGSDYEMFCSSSASNQDVADTLSAAMLQCRG